MSWNWDHVGPYFTLTAFIILTAIVIIAFHHAPYLPEWLPESCLLIIFGVVVGAIAKPLELLPTSEIIPKNCSDNETQHGHHRDENLIINEYDFPMFSSELFFFVLLPPVILESAYSLYDVDFGSNIGTILLYAVVGTLMNTFLIGPLLYLLYWWGAMGKVALAAGGYKLYMTDILVFSSLISAVDPVAVLAIFQETHIDRIIYFLVFGESLLNDAVTVGLYHTMLKFAGGEALSAGRLFLACLKLVAVGVVGLFVGVFFGVISALLTKTTACVRVLEPLLLLGLSYMAYVTAELFEVSGIISLIGCGLVQAHYAMKNVSNKSFTTVKYSTKMASAISEAIIFLFLGMALLTAEHLLHWAFVMWTLIMCLASRFLAVFLLTWLANRYRARTICREEQFIMAYGGLRGAVCFSLVKMLDPCVVQPRNLFLTTSMAVIFFTVFVQGTTIKPMMQIFHIKKSEKEGELLLLDIHQNVNELVLAAMEEITGVTGTFSLVSKLRKWDEKYLQKYFLRGNSEPEVLRAFRRHAILDVKLGRRPPGSGVHLDQEANRAEQQARRRSNVREHQELRKMLGKSRPMTMHRYQVEDTEQEAQSEVSLRQLQRVSQMVVTARRLQEAASRQTRLPSQVFENASYGIEENNETV